MKASARLAVLPDFFVAGHAQGILPFRVEAHMATGACVLDLGVACDDLARRQDRLNGLRMRGMDQTQHQQDQQAAPTTQREGCPTQGRASIGMHGHHMEQGAQDHDPDEGHMGNVPH